MMRSDKFSSMSRETVTRTLAAFRKQRIAALQGSTPLIQNMLAMHKLAAAEAW